MSSLEIAYYAFVAAAPVLFTVAKIFNSNGHRDLSVWTTTIGIVSLVIGGACFYQNFLWKEDAKQAAPASQPLVGNQLAVENQVTVKTPDDEGPAPSPRPASVAEPVHDEQVTIDSDPVFYEHDSGLNQGGILLSKPRFGEVAINHGEWVVTVKNVCQSKVKVDWVKMGIFIIDDDSPYVDFKNPETVLQYFEPMEGTGGTHVEEFELNPGETKDLILDSLYSDYDRTWKVSRLAEIGKPVFLRMKVECMEAGEKPHSTTGVFSYRKNKGFAPYRSLIAVH